MDIQTLTKVKWKHVQKQDFPSLNFVELTANEAQIEFHIENDKHICINGEISLLPVLGSLLDLNIQSCLQQKKLHSLQLQCECLLS